MNAVTIRPPFDPRANAATSRSISPASRTSIGLNSTPNDGGAMAWIAANWPIPVATAGSRRMAIRVRLGAISLSSSSHFPLRLYSNSVNPVALPLGRAISGRSLVGLHFLEGFPDFPFGDVERLYLVHGLLLLPVGFSWPVVSAEQRSPFGPAPLQSLHP
jgi:hypothetical protein